MHERKRNPAHHEIEIVSMETAPISKDVLHTILREILSDGQPICITVTGSSMQPFLRHARDRVCLARCEPSDVKRGDIILYVRDNGAWVMHRVYCVVNGLFTMIGDGQWVLEPNIRKNQVMAKALHAVRDGKDVSCERGVRNGMMKLYLYRMRAPGFFRAVIRGYKSLKAIVKKVIRPAARRVGN